MDSQAGLSVDYVVATAEETGLPDGSFDVVTAGQSWHWFHRERAAVESMRVLVSGGWLVIAHFDWTPLPGNVVEVTEGLIKHHNPQWNMGGGTGIHAHWPRDVAMAGFRDIETFSFDLDASYTHEAWRGSIRASAGVGASLPTDQVAEFDGELAALLRERFPGDPLPVPHRVFALVCRASHRI